MFYFLILFTICEKSGALAFSLNSTEDPKQLLFFMCFIILSRINPLIKIIDIIENTSIYIIFI